jgi:post-segregation antitoxin (ccd killing protein)
MGAPAAKLSITVPSALAAEVRRRVGARGVSSFVTRAIAHELEREQLTAYLEELDREFGPVPKEALADARRAWRKR